MKEENDRKVRTVCSSAMKTLENKTHELQPTAMMISLAFNKSLHFAVLFIIC